ncbi:GDSL-type esterase/lipase family protein [Chloroflexota bacterium]
MFGDSITRGCTELFRNTLTEEYKEIELTIINAGIDGETSVDGLARLQNVISQKPDVVVIGFGMNDWRKGVNRETFAVNLKLMVDKLEEHKARVILMTIIPDYQGFLKKTSVEISAYNNIIYNISEEKKVKIADINAFWRREIKPVWIGLSDQIHPNRRGYELICEALMRVVPRRNTTVLWGYNGAASPCNYKCPYCSDSNLTPKRHHFKGTMSQWHDAFKKGFGNQHVTFYISYGEPMVGKVFYEMLEMFASEPNWKMMMTSNLSQPLDKLVKTQLVIENRLNINSSFHPTETTPEEFLKKILFLREYGIECPVIYVMYPPQMKDFEHYFSIFNKYNFLIHVRMFEGKYKGKTYPRAYTEQERQFIAKYADSGTIKYMLNRPNLYSGYSYHGVYYFFVTSEGEVGTEYYGGQRLGNILKGTMELNVEPQRVLQSPERSVTDISSMIKTGYHEFEGNYVISYANQGGIYHTEDGVHYPHLHTDFSSKNIRREYNFPTKIGNLKLDILLLIHFGLQKLRSKLHNLS